MVPFAYVATVQVEALNAGVGPVGDVERLAVSREAVGDLKLAWAGSFCCPMTARAVRRRCAARKK